jgi:hypothetical protein
MTGEERDRRDSRALEPELITDPQAKAAAEARNGFRQYDAAIGATKLRWSGGRSSFGPRSFLVDVSKMEELLGSLLANQLAQFYRSVGGKLPS